MLSASGGSVAAAPRASLPMATPSPLAGGPPELGAARHGQDVARRRRQWSSSSRGSEAAACSSREAAWPSQASVVVQPGAEASDAPLPTPQSSQQQQQPPLEPAQQQQRRGSRYGQKKQHQQRASGPGPPLNDGGAEDHPSSSPQGTLPPTQAQQQQHEQHRHNHNRSRNRRAGKKAPGGIRARDPDSLLMHLIQACASLQQLQQLVRRHAQQLKGTHLAALLHKAVHMADTDPRWWWEPRAAPPQHHADASFHAPRQQPWQQQQPQPSPALASLPQAGGHASFQALAAVQNLSQLQPLAGPPPPLPASAQRAAVRQLLRLVDQVAHLAAGSDVSEGTHNPTTSSSGSGTTTSGSTGGASSNGFHQHQQEEGQQQRHATPLPPPASPQQHASAEALAPDSASIILSSLAKLGYAEERLIRRVLDRSRAALPHATPRQLSNMLWACAMLSVRPADEWALQWQLSMQRHLAQGSLPSAPAPASSAKAGAGDVAAGGVAAAGEEAMLAPAEQPLCLLDGEEQASDSGDCGSMAAAAAGPQQQAAPPTAAAAGSVGHGSAASMVMQQVATAVYTLGKLGHQPEPLFMQEASRVALEAVQHAAALSGSPGGVAGGAGGGGGGAWHVVWRPRDLANFCAGLAACKHLPDDQWVERFMQASSQLLSSFSMCELQRMLGALAALGCRPTDAWLERFYARCHELLSTSSGGGGSTLGLAGMGVGAAAGMAAGGQWQHSALSVGDMAGMTGALARLGCRPDMQWMDTCLAHVRAAMPRAGARDLTQLLAALAQLQYRPGDVWMQAYLAARFRQLGGCAPEEVVQELQGLLRLGQSPSPIWLHELVCKVQDRLQHYSGDQLGSLLSCLARLRHRPPADWLCDWEVASQGRLEALGAGGLTACVWALAQLRHQPSVSWLYSYVLAAYGKLDAFDSVQLGVVFEALPLVAPHPGWLDELVQICASESIPSGGRGLASVSYDDGGFDAPFDAAPPATATTSSSFAYLPLASDGDGALSGADLLPYGYTSMPAAGATAQSPTDATVVSGGGGSGPMALALSTMDESAALADGMASAVPGMPSQPRAGRAQRGEEPQGPGAAPGASAPAQQRRHRNQKQPGRQQGQRPDVRSNGAAAAAAPQGEQDSAASAASSSSSDNGPNATAANGNSALGGSTSNGSGSTSNGNGSGAGLWSYMPLGVREDVPLRVYDLTGPQDLPPDRTSSSNPSASGGLVNGAPVNGVARGPVNGAAVVTDGKGPVNGEMRAGEPCKRGTQQQQQAQQRQRPRGASASASTAAGRAPRTRGQAQQSATSMRGVGVGNGNGAVAVVDMPMSMPLVVSNGAPLISSNGSAAGLAAGALLGVQGNGVGVGVGGGASPQGARLVPPTLRQPAQEAPHAPELVGAPRRGGGGQRLLQPLSVHG